MISENYDGRPGCNGCGICNGCPRGSMSKFSLSVWPKALDRRREAAHLRARAQDRDGPRRPRHRRRLRRSQHRTETDFQAARIVVVAANGVGTPRLLLASDNLANRSDQVGRNLLHHTLVALEMWVDEPIESHMGYVASLIRRAIRRDRRQPRLRQRLPVQLPDRHCVGRRAAAGWVTETKAPWGRGHHRWFEKHFGHVIGVYAIGDDLPNPDNRVTLDPVACDRDGVPVARLHYAPGENDRRMMNFMLDRLVEIAQAADAFEYKLTDYRDKEGVYRTPAWHMIGTCRMGDDPDIVGRQQMAPELGRAESVHRRRQRADHRRRRQSDADDLGARAARGDLHPRQFRRAERDHAFGGGLSRCCRPRPPNPA